MLGPAPFASASIQENLRINSQVRDCSGLYHWHILIGYAEAQSGKVVQKWPEPSRPLAQGIPIQRERSAYPEGCGRGLAAAHESQPRGMARETKEVSRRRPVPKRPKAIQAS